MAKTKQPAYRKAVTEARERARENAAARARERRQNTSVLIGFGLSFVLLGGSAGGYMALESLSAGAAGPSVAISLGDEPVISRQAAVQLALADTTEFQVSLPTAPTAPLKTAPLKTPPLRTALPETADRRAALGAAFVDLADLANFTETSTEAPQELPPTSEASEAAIAALDEAPLETAAGPLSPALTAVQQAALPLPTLTDKVSTGRPAWQRFAVSVPAPGARPMIAVVLDDLGLNRVGTRRAIELPGPLTLAFMTYADGLPRQVARARQAGHELLLHVPMAPRDPNYDPGPNVLHSELTPDELMRRLEWGLDRFEGYVGINNHMGSRFTGSIEGMNAVMAALRARGLLFLDSVTAGTSRGAAIARRAGVPFATRDVFLDNDWSDRAAIARQFDRLEAVARRNGSAVGIGHPHRATLDVLARWLPEARARGFEIVPISAIVRHRMGLGTQYVETSG